VAGGRARPGARPAERAAAAAPAPAAPAPARRTRGESQADTRERLLETARELFARASYAGASVDAIAAAAGYTKGAVYANFASKEALFVELLRRHKDAELGALRAVVEAPGDARAALDALGALLAATAEDTDWALLSVELQRRAARSPELAAEYAALHAGQQAALGRLVAALFAKAGRRLPAAADDLAAAFMGLAHGLVLQRPPGPAAAGAHAREGRLLVLMLESVLAAAPPAAPPRAARASRVR
jgi:AcrR family transcriptional regulator